jgi:transposase-like protein
MDKESLERLLTQGLSLAAIGARFGRDPSTVGYWLRKHGLRAAYGDKHRSRGGLSRADLEPLVESGASVATIAEQLGFSETSVKYWLRKWGFQTHGAVRRERSRRAKEAGLATAELICGRHGLTEFWIEGRGSYRCMKCRGEWVARRRRKVKEILVAEAGGRCAICGYDRCIAALQFHHVDPATKSFALGHQGFTRSLARMREEAGKCVLLCANCHAEVGAGILELEKGTGNAAQSVPQTGSPG